ncbi:MAG: ABC transporter ATP-binding protein [Holosporaceae bacterium]|nr:MAG: ABC transporter ATP-binding protein [Holosporaceae bacterium]
MSVVSLKKVSVDFPIFNGEKFSLRSTIINKLGGQLAEENDSVSSVKALKDITFDVQKGDRIGLVGHNGSGKSTLLRTIAGIYTHTSGELRVSGNVSTLFDIGSGFNDEMTGNENLFFGALVYGNSFKKAKESMTAMQEFTELGDYLNLPMRTYSQGMKTRIGFAVATNFEPEILLIDEVFGAGDKDFFEKSKKRIESLVEKSNALFLASHSDDLIRKFCNKAILMSHGEMKAFGAVEDVFSLYYEKNPEV